MKKIFVALALCLLAVSTAYTGQVAKLSAPSISQCGKCHTSTPSVIKEAVSPIVIEPVEIKSVAPVKEKVALVKKFSPQPGITTGTHVVQPGDTLNKISGRRYGKISMVPEIKKANGLKSDLIRIGQKLTLPVPTTSLRLTNNGADKFGAKAVKANVKVIDFVKSSWLYQSQIDELVRVISEIDSNYEADMVDRTVVDCASTGTWGGFCSTSGYEISFAKGASHKVRGWKVQVGESIIYVVVADICGNVMIWNESAPVPPPVVTKTMVPPVAVVPPVKSNIPSKPPAPPITAESKFADSCGELSVGAGSYSNVEGHHNGGFWYASANCRPFNALDRKVEYGVQAKTVGWGGSDFGYNYHGYKYSLGPSAKFLGKGYEVEANAGLGQQFDLGGKDGYKSDQITNIIDLSLYSTYHDRRDHGQVWFPWGKIGVDATIGLSGDRESSLNGVKRNEDLYDPTTVSLSVNQAVYDFNLNGSTISAMANASIGHESGNDNYFLKAGPGAVWRNHGEDILTLNVLNYKINSATASDQWEWVSVNLSVNGAVAAYKKAHIKPAGTVENIPVAPASEDAVVAKTVKVEIPRPPVE